MYQQYRTSMSDGDSEDARAERLRKAASAGDLAAVSELVEGTGVAARDSLLRQRDQTGATALYLAAEAGHCRVVDYLLKFGAYVNARRRHRWTPLHTAARHNHIDVVQQLVQAGAEVDRATNRGLTALMLAAKHKSTDTARVLLNLGAQVNLDDMFGRSAAFWAVKSGSREILDLVIEAGADLSWRDSFKKTLVIQAAKSNQPDLLQYLLTLGSDVMAEEKRYRAPIHMAVVKGRPQCLQVLLDHGISPDSSASNFRRPLQIAAAECQYRPLETLLQDGADVAVRDSHGSTPLHELALTSRLPPRRGRPDRPLCSTALFLVRAGVDLEALSTARSLRWRPDDPRPLTALEVATKCGRCLSLIKLLARAGSRPRRLFSLFDCEPQDLPPGLRNNPLVLNWLQAYYSRPRGLRELCRGVVRQCLGSVRGMDCLPVPRDLVAYLNYIELEELTAGESLDHSEPDNNSECDYNPSVFDSDYGDDPNIIDSDLSS